MMSWLRLCTRHLTILVKTPQPSTVALTQITPVTFALTQIQSVRGYKKKGEILPESGKKWMLRVLEKAKQPVSKDNLEVMARKLQYMEEKGCKSYQLMEYPEALLLTEEEIIARVECLQKMNVNPISIPLLKIVRNQRYKSSNVMKFVQRRGGHVSLADFLKSTLECSEDELMDILNANPRLVSMHSIENFQEKVNLLLKSGASIKDIRRHTGVLKNKSLESIRERCEELVNLGCNNPLPVQWINHTDAVYRNVVQNFQASLKDQQEKHEFFQKVLHMDESSIPNNRPIIRQQFRTLKPKIEFLVSKGIDINDLAYERILHRSLKTLKETFKTLEAYGIDDVTPSLLDHFVTYKRVSQVTHNRHLNEPLPPKTPEQRALPPTMRRLLCLQKRSVLIENYKFLQECGFSKEHIQKLVIILGHDPKILRRQWALLPRREELFPFEAWEEDRWKLLNLLQYYIEKEVNFAQPIVFANNIA